MDLLIVGAFLVGVVLIAMLVLWLRRSQDVVVVPPAPSAQLGGDASTEVQMLLAQGKKIEAIKRVRELTGLGLKEAKDYVDALQQESAPPALPATATSDAPMAGAAEFEQEARELLAQGKKIEAIKRVRELSGLSLKEAKDYVERL
jgi:ribosomal protein L7/L12